MFTGIVQHVGQVVSWQPPVGPRAQRLVIDPRGWVYQPKRGESICNSGVCLTVVPGPSASSEPAVDHLHFDVIADTLAKTTLGVWQPGRLINLEHAVLASTPMGGHVVQGHVDATAEVVAVESAAAWRVRVRPPAGLMLAMVPQGAICLDGVSLTIADLDAQTVTVSLIPETLSQTTLGGLKVGDFVNVEADILTKTIVSVVERVLAAGKLGART